MLLLAFYLRIHTLAERALWWDEGLSVSFARFNYLENARYASTIADYNPPIYRFSLGYWLQLVGKSIWLIRFYSVFWSMLTLPLIYRIGRVLALPQPATLFALILSALSPMLIYYAQEAKGYSLITTFCLLIFLLWHQLLQNRNDVGKWWQWVLLGLFILPAVGSHYISSFLLFYLNLWTVWKCRHNWTRQKAAGFLARLWGVQLLVILLFVPFVLTTYGNVSAQISNDTGKIINLDGAFSFFAYHFAVFMVGPFGVAPEGCNPQMYDLRCTFTPTTAWLPGLILATLTIAGTIVAIRKKHRQAVDLVGLIIIPLFLGYLLNSFHQFFFPRFLLYLVPFVLLLAGIGLQTLNHIWRWSWLVGLALFLIATQPGLWRYYHHSTGNAGEWRPITQTIKSIARDGDALVYAWAWVPGYVEADVDNQFDYELAHYTPDSRPVELAQLLKTYERVWLLDYLSNPYDTTNANARWLLENSALAHNYSYETGHMSLFVSPSAVLNPATADTQQATFENGYRLQFAPLKAQATPNQPIAVELIWHANTPSEQSLTVFLHLLDQHGQLVAQRDSYVQNGLRPFDSNWDAPVTEWRGLLLPSELAEGVFSVYIGLYAAENGQRVRLTNGAESVHIGSLTIR